MANTDVTESEASKRLRVLQELYRRAPGTDPSVLVDTRDVADATGLDQLHVYGACMYWRDKGYIELHGGFGGVGWARLTTAGLDFCEEKPDSRAAAPGVAMGPVVVQNIMRGVQIGGVNRIGGQEQHVGTQAPHSGGFFHFLKVIWSFLRKGTP